ncbi:MAG TPA: ankyrin repeat domain-containing protein [Candidatus Akkermansia intestinigallinarum]|uniref:Ankyrin repeat domain-containing protein n=1 Tax=Candidatus Akkermansia intestinigallinarum TaxID=2838431 RepID=A0A9D1VBC9_9BACT|nr:ankyrin repeat domain-containing protein [Candidatus Akkermansia intestinigallinarum]
MSDSHNRNTEAEQKQLLDEVQQAEAAAPRKKPEVQWKPIINDMLVLMLVAVVLGLFSKFAMKPFEIVYDAQDLISIAHKAEADFKKGAPQAFASLQNETFSKELDKRLEAALRDGVDFINCTDNTGRTPLMWLCYSNFNSPQTLCYAYVSDEKDEKGKTNLKNFHDYIKKQDGEDYNAFFDNEDLYCRPDLARYFYTNRLLAQAGIDVHATDEDGFNALHWAAWSGLPFNCARLLERGVDINAAEGNGYTPLMLAALRGQRGAVRMLLALGADTSLKNFKGETALSIAESYADAYAKRDQFPYGLICSENRIKDYAAVIELLKNPGSVPPIDADDCVRVAQIAVTAYVIQRDKAEEEKKAEEEAKYHKSAQPAEQPAAEQQPASEQQPAEPAEQPAAEQQPAEPAATQPAAEQQPAEPAAAQPAAEQQPAEPAATQPAAEPAAA